jgi:16S rRNA (guanine(966)-N(2))-methyltransferase RsmD
MTLRISGGRKLLSPPGEISRPTASRVRLAVMNLLAPDLPGSRWLDLCCGSGVMACEAIQRGADAVVAIEQDRRIAAIAKANLEAVAQGSPSKSRFWVHCSDVKRWLARGAGASADSAREGDGAFDLIYADPPYAAGLYGAIATGVSRGGWLKPNGLMVWECATAKLPNLPAGWQLADQRRYGSTSLMVLKLGSAVEDGAATVLVPSRHE